MDFSRSFSLWFGWRVKGSNSAQGTADKLIFGGELLGRTMIVNPEDVFAGGAQGTGLLRARLKKRRQPFVRFRMAVAK
jgi:hypothetical protein